MTMAWAVLAAAGSGQRFGGTVPKQHLLLAGNTLLQRSLAALVSHPAVTGAVVVLAKSDTHAQWNADDRTTPLLRAEGGATRAASVLAGLRVIPAEHAGLVLVHDAARPNLQHADIDRLLAAASTHRDGALLATPVRDTLKQVDAQRCVTNTPPREHLWRALTPQCFRRDLLEQALAQADAAGVGVSDEAMAVERLGFRPLVVEGREDNLKVTTPADLAYLEFLLERAA